VREGEVPEDRWAGHRHAVPRGGGGAWPSESLGFEPLTVMMDRNLDSLQGQCNATKRIGAEGKKVQTFSEIF